jgi:peptide chain release factor 1
MFDRLEQMEDRYKDLETQLALPEVQNDREAYHKASKAHRDLEDTVEKFREYKQVAQGVADAKMMLGESDPEIAAMAAADGRD